MIRSMTGFARQEEALANGQLSCEIRSVNHRFLEVSVRMPDDFRSLEPTFRQILGAALKRGKVDCSLSVRAGSGGNVPEVDIAVLSNVMLLVKRVAREAGEGAHIDAVDLLRWPGVISERPRDAAALTSAAQSLFERTVAELMKFREAEGARLRQALDERCTGIGALAETVAQRLPEVRARLRTKWLERIAQVATGIDANRLEQELAMQAQRLDIDEEVDRLRGHLIEVRKTFDAPEAAGRRLDFLMQELNREANTLSSKSQDLETTRAAVEMKVLIEQMREQVQNIE